MATTKIWDVNGRINNVLEYAKNPNKTEKIVFSKDDFQALRDVMNYTTQDYKTEKQLYVSGIKCVPNRAREQMIMTKQKFSKEGGIVAFHAYQSFAPGEVDANTAHEIGVRLAKELWGEKFQVVVATHLDKAHYHNHFVINSVSYKDGKRYHDCKDTYRAFRKKSDELCREYNLSVIENPKHKGMHYSEWKAANEGKPTWRSIIKEDIDNALSTAFTFNQLLANLKAQGYEVKTGGKYIAIKPKEKERYVRLKSLGYGYSEDDIKDKILYGEKQSSYKRTSSFNPFGNKGLRGLYYHYLYELGILPKPNERKRKNALFLYREELIKLDSLIEQYNFIATHGIDTYAQLTSYKDNLYAEISALKEELVVKSDEQKQPIYEALKQKRKEVRLCDAVKQRSEELSDKLTKNGEDTSTHKKEVIQKNKERNEEK